MSEKRRKRDQKEHKMIQKYKKEEIDKIKNWNLDQTQTVSTLKLTVWGLMTHPPQGTKSAYVPTVSTLTPPGHSFNKTTFK